MRKDIQADQHKKQRIEKDVQAAQQQQLQFAIVKLVQRLVQRGLERSLDQM